VELQWRDETPATLTAEPRPAIVGGAPAEYGGRNDWWSPEHLLLSSLSLCFMTTYQAIARKAQVPISRFESRAAAILDKTKDGLQFTSMELNVEIRAPAEFVDQAMKLLETAKKYCIVSNGLKAPVTVQGKVRGV
jgi:organic hydroperoxide reductase OsmC/OhrA